MSCLRLAERVNQPPADDCTRPRILTARAGGGKPSAVVDRRDRAVQREKQAAGNSEYGQEATSHVPERSGPRSAGGLVPVVLVLLVHAPSMAGPTGGGKREVGAGGRRRPGWA